MCAAALKRRRALRTVERKTRETAVTVALKLDGTGRGETKTGVPFLDHMLESFARHGFFDLDGRAPAATSTSTTITRSRTSASCSGARFAQALGDRSGIKRFGEATVPLDEALCTAVVDISGRVVPRLQRDDQRRSGSAPSRPSWCTTS